MGERRATHTRKGERETERQGKDEEGKKEREEAELDITIERE